MEHTIEITSLANGGDGIGRIDGMVCFVPYGLPGDTLRVRITRSVKNARWAEILEVLSPSPERTTPDCPVFGHCGGCAWFHFAYPQQAEWKQRLVRESLERIAGISTELEWRENPALRLGYRTRAEFHGDGKRLGFYAARSHDIVNIDQCPLCHPKLNAALPTLHKAGIKGAVTITVNPEGDEVLVWTTFTKRSLKDRFPLSSTPADKTPRSQFMLDGVPVVNSGFSQASLLLNRLLVKTTQEMIGKAESLLDLYCGSGNLSLALADRMRVYGVDHHHASVKAADKVGKAHYEAGTEEDMVKQAATDDWDIILLDPPREGAKAVMPALSACQARAIVYVSCDPATLARDLKTLAAAGWKPVRTVVLDLFPNTPHMETVCRLER